MLKNIEIGKQKKPFRFLLHGVEGIGKSTFAAASPKPIFVQTEDGIGEIETDRFPLAKTYDDVMIALRCLSNEEHGYLTVVIDSIDWLEKLASSEVLKHYPSAKTLADIEYGKGYAGLIPLFSQVIEMLDDLRNERGMNIILIAHTKMEKVEDPTGASYDQYAPRLDKRVNSMIKEWVDIIGFATHSIVKVSQDETMGRERVVAKATSEGRRLYLESTPAIVAKTRYRLDTDLSLGESNRFFTVLWNLTH